MVNCVECGAPLGRTGESCGACGADLTPGTVNGKHDPQIEESGGLLCEDRPRHRDEFQLRHDDARDEASDRPSKPAFVAQPLRDDPSVSVPRFASAPQIVDAGPKPAGFASRAVAFLIDIAMLSCLDVALLALATAAVLLAERVSGQRVGGAIDLVRSSVSAGSMTLFIGYFSVLHARSGQTIGKVAMRIRVEETSGERVHIVRSILRTLGYGLSALAFGLGFLLALGPARRALHDRIAGTVVVRQREDA